MAIRQNTNPHNLELHPELQDILMRNGMRATVTGSGNGFQLVVQGHDSPLLYYPITEKQLRALVDWGTNTANKRAYTLSPPLWRLISTFPAISYMRVTPTDVWRWVSTATA